MPRAPPDRGVSLQCRVQPRSGEHTYDYIMKRLGNVFMSHFGIVYNAAHVLGIDETNIQELYQKKTDIYIYMQIHTATLSLGGGGVCVCGGGVPPSLSASHLLRISKEVTWI